ncbi:MAG: ribonuclease P protein component [Actinomycetota bacterium]
MPDGPFSKPEEPRAANGSRPKPVAIRTPEDFGYVLAAGRRLRAGNITVVRASGQRGVIRYGLVAGKRIGNAVQRNRIKRRLRHAVAAAALPTGFDYVLIASASVGSVQYAVLVDWVAQAGGDGASQNGAAWREGGA